MKNNNSPWPRNIILRGLAAIWSSITMFLSLFLVLILFLSKQIVNKGWKDGAWEFIIVENSWLYKKTIEYSGFSFGWCILYSIIGYNNLTTRTHERVHLAQQLKLSIFQWIFYLLFSVIIFFGTNLNPYLANPFEIDARIKAGQNLGNLERIK